jgi:hypothetical protein
MSTRVDLGSLSCNCASELLSRVEIECPVVLAAEGFRTRTQNSRQSTIMVRPVQRGTVALLSAERRFVEFLLIAIRWRITEAPDVRKSYELRCPLSRHSLRIRNCGLKTGSASVIFRSFSLALWLLGRAILAFGPFFRGF